MVSNISLDVRKYIDGNAKAFRNVEEKLAQSNLYLKAEEASEFVRHVKLILSNNYTYTPTQLHRTLILVQRVLGLDNLVLLNLITTELQPIIFQIRTCSKPYNMDLEMHNQILKEAASICKFCNRLTPGDLSTESDNQPATSGPGSTSASSSESAKETSKVQEKCLRCGGAEVFLLSCQTETCKNCLAAYVVSKVNKSKSEVRCPCGNSLPEHWLEVPTIITWLDFERAREFLRRKSFGEQKYRLVSCPQCHGPACTEEQSVCLGQCGGCCNCFCTLCKGPYHGFTDCPTDENKVKAIERKSPSRESEPEADKAQTTNEEETEGRMEGAEAAGYEIEFYKSCTSDSFSEKIGKIDRAFETVTDPEGNLFPWEFNPIQNFTLKDSDEFSCLSEGKWLDDVVIEKAILGVLSNREINSAVTLLESYIYSYFLHHSQEDFYKLIIDKPISSRRFLLAVMNTETQSVGGHWIVGIVDQLKNTMILMDTSMVLSPRFYRRFFYFLLNTIYLSRNANGLHFDPNSWKLSVQLDTVQQQNAYDCGALVVANVYGFVEFEMVLRVPDSASLRRWIYEIVTKKDLVNGRGLESSGPVRSKLKRFDEIPTFQPFGLTYIYSTQY